VIVFQLELLTAKKDRESLSEALVTAATSIVCGMALVTQSSFNQRVGLILGDMRASPVISAFTGVTISLIANLALLPEYKMESEKFAWDNLWLWTGGMIGSFGLCCITYAPSKIGMVVTFTCMVLGQLIGALAFDALGLFGVDKRPATVKRVIGVALTFIGVIVTNMRTDVKIIKVVEAPLKITSPQLKKYNKITKGRVGDNLVGAIHVCV